MENPPRCAHCEVSPATLECEDEDLLYCTPCSASLHAKRARAHHVLRPLRLCDQCEAAAALLSCVLCGGRGDPLAFCLNCSSDLHSRKARAHHKLDTIPTTHLQRPSKGLPNHGGRKPFIESYSNTSGTCELSQDSISRKHPRRGEEPFGAANKENHGPVASRNPRRILPQKHSSDGSSSSSEEDTSEDDETYGTKKYRKGSVTLEAFVVDAHDHEEGQTSRGAFPEHYQDEAEGGVQARIRKMLELGLHPDTPDIEAQQALKNAQRLLTKHNLQQADVLKGGLQANKHAFKGGMRMVELRSKDKNQPGRFEHWVYSLALTVAKYFDTQYFVQRRSVLQVVFYGIKQNVDCAGYAFAATFNRITKLSADYIPSKLQEAGKSNKGCKLKVGSSQSVYSRVSRMSYRNGLAEGLFETVKSSKLQQKSSTNCRGREKNEKVNSKGATSAGNIADTRYSDWGSSDDECLSPDDFDGLDDADECVSRHSSPRSSQDWETDRSAAVSALIVHSKKVGDDFLKEKKIKVTTRKQESPTIWDGEAFLKGKRDSKTIDLGQKGITAKARKTAAL